MIAHKNIKDVSRIFNDTDDAAELTLELLTPAPQLSWDLLDLLTPAPDPSSTAALYSSLLKLPQPIGRTAFRFTRLGISGDITGCTEQPRLAADQASPATSLSLMRSFAPKTDALRGKTAFLPFQPGGIVGKGVPVSDSSSMLHRNEAGLFDVPPGMNRGLNVRVDASDAIDLDDTQSNDNDENLANDNDEPANILDNNQDVNHDSTKPNTASAISFSFDTSDIDGIVPADYSSFKTDTAIQHLHKQDWAHVVDLDHKLDNFHELVPKMAREWPFELDVFQKEAVYHLEQGDSVFVAAHTSAGKTVVAEYAIAMANRNMTKTIYTSPIKALSNQKFRDFKETFTDVDVGLITGDVQINPEANCLIMTTEVLRSMLYRGADLIRDVEFVVFDEVHYVNDIDRGVVWEEVIIMLPSHVKYILLSATVPNTFEFANWVGRTKQKDIYVISTPKRPVPLEIFISAKDMMFKVVDANRAFSDTEFKKHKLLLEGDTKPVAPKAVMGSGSRGGSGGTARGGNRGGARGGRGGRGGQGGGQGGGRGGGFSGSRFQQQDGPNKNTWINLVHFLKKNSLLPAVVFVFSKKKCETYADSLNSVDFCTAREKSEIHMFVDRAVARLKREDRELPQILKVRDMLSRGIAVHHGGLLPIVKECIEILFAKTLVKVLFATETFAMGLNLPTRTVVFLSMRKHDGREFRNLLPGEFTQMAGRAGRRGLDPTGTVIVMAYTQALSPTDFKDVVLGKPTKLSLQFRLTYNMILNLLRIEALRVEEMIKHSFSENSTQVLMPENKKRVQELQGKIEALDANNGVLSPEIEELFRAVAQYEDAYTELVKYVQLQATLRHSLLRPGRLLAYRDINAVTRIGFAVKTLPEGILVLTFDHGESYDRAARASRLPYLPLPLHPHFPKIKFCGNLRVVLVPFDRVHFCSRYALKALINDVLENNTAAIKSVSEEISWLLRLQNKWQELSFDGKVSKLVLYELQLKKDKALMQIHQLGAYLLENFAEEYAKAYERSMIDGEIAMLQRSLLDENLELLPDYQQRLEVLETLGFIDSHHNVVLKGRVACEINLGWELVITEIVLNNFLADYEPAEIVALLSCFVYEGRTNEEEPLCITPRLELGKKQIGTIVESMLATFTEKRVLLTLDELEFTQRKRFALVNVIYEWARGLSFNEIMQMSVEAEGTIVRVISRLDEVCREVKNAALVVGDSQLHAKMSQAQELIKRDIVFCASLYL